MQENIKEINKYLQGFWRYRYFASILALVVMSAVGAYSFTLPKQYKADSTVFIEKNVIDRLVRGLAVTPSLNDRIRVLRYALSSRDLIAKTLEEVGSDIFTKSKAEQQNYINELKRQTKISVRGSDLFIVSLIGTDPRFIRDYVNTLVNKYVEENISSKREEAYGANRFLSEQIEMFKGKLDKAEDEITQFRKEQGIYFSVDDGAMVEGIKKHLAEIEAIDLTVATLEAQKQQLQEQLDTLSPTIESVFSVGGNSGGIENNPQLAAMEKQLSNLRLRYTDNYPEISRLKFEIKSLRTRLASQVEPEQATETSKMTSLNPLYLDVQQRLLETQSQISSNLSRKQNLERAIGKLEKDMDEVPENKKQLQVLVEERNSYKKIYNDLLARISQSEVSKQMEIANKTATFRVVDPAIIPEVPVSPNMMKMLIMAIFAGLGSAAGLVFLLVNLDTRVRSVDVLKGLGYDVLAVVPNIADQQVVWRKRKRDLLFFSLMGGYAFCFVGLFLFETFLR